MEYPVFSVVIPTFNRATSLKRSLNSLVDQTFKDFEVLVCDDGSTDNTELIVCDFKSLLNIKYLKLSNSGSASNPRNVGIKLAVANWVCFLDSDDYWMPDKLSVCLRFLEQSDIIYHHLEICTNGSRAGQQRLICRSLSKEDPFRDLLLNWNGLATSSVVVRKSILLLVGGFDLKLKYGEDFDLWLRLALTTRRFHLIPRSLGYYTFSEDSLTEDIEKHIRGEGIIFDKYASYYTNTERAKTAGLLKYNAGVYYLKRGRLSAARNRFFSAILSRSSVMIKVKSIVCLLAGHHYFRAVSFLVVRPNVVD